MIAYLDTSALVKLFVHEPGTEEALRLWDAATLRTTAILAYAECRAALAAAVRAHRLTAPGLRTARRLLNDHWDELAHIGVGERMVRAAGELAESQALRGYDAIHLAAAVAAGEGGTLVFVTWDRVLADAAARVGLPVAPLWA